MKVSSDGTLYILFWNYDVKLYLYNEEKYFDK